MKEILIVAPTREMYKRAMSIIEVECYDNISVEYGTLKDSLPITTCLIHYIKYPS